MKKAVLLLFLLLLVAAGILFGPRVYREVMCFLYPRPYYDIVAEEAAQFQLDESLVFAVIKAESGFDETAQSHAGAHGLMQLTEETFHWIGSLYPPENGGEDLMDPRDNIHCGCALLRYLLDHFGDFDAAVCAYNAGMGNVGTWLESAEYSEDGITLHTIPYPETRAYLKKIKEYKQVYESLYDSSANQAETS